MLKRVITSVIGLIVFFVILFMGEIAFNCGIFLLMSIMLYEVYRSVKCHFSMWIIGGISSAIIAYATTIGQYQTGALFFSIAMYLISSVFLHGRVDYKSLYSHGFLTLFITIFMSTIALIRSCFGIYAVLIIFICAWTTDTGAYFVGKFFGKHKLIPHVSPKKTVEGAIGGIIVCMLSCALYLFILNRISIASIEGMNKYTQFIVLGGVASVFSQIGDLVASVIKRDCNVKDFGHILPGHGGILDRFDSVVFIAPFIYYLLTFIIR